MRSSAGRPSGARWRSGVVGRRGRAGGRQLGPRHRLARSAFIPISIVLGVNGQFLALLVTLAGIVGVNVAHAWQSRHQSAATPLEGAGALAGTRLTGCEPF